MAFAIKKKESLEKAVRRLCCSRIRHALACISGCPRAKAIHSARKDIKKVRAVLRMIRSDLPRKDYRRAMEMLREAAHPLAGPRDAFIKTRTLRRLRSHFKKQRPPGAMRWIGSELQKQFESEMADFSGKRGNVSVQKTLRLLKKGLGRIRIRRDGWKILGPGLTRAYKRSRRGYRAAASTPVPESFHVWRKRAKDLWYQVTLLQFINPKQMRSLGRELCALTDSLGEDHDLSVLRQAVHEAGGSAEVRGLQALDAAIRKRQEKLRAAALEKGAQLHAEGVSDFTDQLAGYWREWR